MKVLEYESLLGVTYVDGVTDCYELMRKFYALNYGIELISFARPALWWAKDPTLDLLRQHLPDNRFVPYTATARNMRPGDGLLMQVGDCPVLNHCGAYLGNGRFLHHPFRQKSQVSLLAGLWADRVMIHCRHLDIQQADTRPAVDLMDLLPATKRENYRARMAEQQG